MDSDGVEFVECACYTSARRHPEVLGRIGRTVLPFQVTAAALLVGVGSFVGLVWSWRWWGQLVPTALALVVVLAVPLVLGRAAQVTAVGGRSPFRAAAGLARYMLRARGGVVAGRPVRRGARRRVHGRCRIEVE